MARKPAVQLDFSKFFDAFRGESGRAAAVLGAAYVEARLERLFRSRLLAAAPDSLFAFRGALGDFAGKIDLAFSAGWISADSRHDLHIIRDIRNDFAHDVDHTLAFDTQSVRDRTANLRGPNRLQEVIKAAMPATSDTAQTSQEKMMADMFGTSRKRFEIAVANLELTLSKAVAESTPPTEKVDKWEAVNLGSVTLADGEIATIDLKEGRIRKP